MAVTTKDKELNVKQAQAQAKKTQRIAARDKARKRMMEEMQVKMLGQAAKGMASQLKAVGLEMAADRMKSSVESQVTGRIPGVFGQLAAKGINHAIDTGKVKANQELDKVIFNDYAKSKGKQKADKAAAEGEFAHKADDEAVAENVAVEEANAPVAVEDGVESAGAAGPVDDAALAAEVVGHEEAKAERIASGEAALAEESARAEETSSAEKAAAAAETAGADKVESNVKGANNGGAGGADAGAAAGGAGAGAGGAGAGGIDVPTQLGAGAPTVAPKGAGTGKHAVEAFSNSGLSYQVENFGGLGDKASADVEKSQKAIEDKLPGEEGVEINDGKADADLETTVSQTKDSNEGVRDNAFDANTTVDLENATGVKDAIEAQKTATNNAGKDDIPEEPVIEADTSYLEEGRIESDSKHSDAQSSGDAAVQSIDRTLPERGFDDIHDPRIELEATEALETENVATAEEIAGLDDEGKGLMDVCEAADSSAGEISAASAQIDAAEEQSKADADAEISEHNEAVEKAKAEASEEEAKIVAEQKSDLDSKVDSEKTQYQNDIGKLNEEQKAEITKAQGKIDSERSKVQSELDKEHKKAKEDKKNAEKDAEKEGKGSSNVFKKAANWVKDKVKKAAAWLKEKLSTIINAIKQKICSLLDRFADYVSLINKDLGAKLKKCTEKLKQYLDKFANKLIELVNKAIDKVTDKINQLVDKVVAKIEALVTAFKAAISAIGKWLKEQYDKALAAIKKVLSALGNIFLFMLKKAMELAGVDPSIFANAFSVAKEIVHHPGRFFSTLGGGFVLGFKQFFSNMPENALQVGKNLLNLWLSASGVQLPDEFSVGGFIKFGLSLLGIDLDSILKCLGIDKVWSIGKSAVGVVKKGYGNAMADSKDKKDSEEETEQEEDKNSPVTKVVNDIKAKGIGYFVDAMKEHAGDIVKEILIEALKTIGMALLEKGIEKLIMLATPVSGIIMALKAAWDLIKFIRSNMSALSALATSLINLMGSAAQGDKSTVGTATEAVLCQAIPLLFDLLLKMVGLNVGEKIQGVIMKLREKVQKLLDKVMKPIKSFLESTPIGKANKGVKNLEKKVDDKVQGVAKKINDTDAAKKVATSNINHKAGMWGKHMSHELKDSTMAESDNSVFGKISTYGGAMDGIANALNGDKNGTLGIQGFDYNGSTSYYTLEQRSNDYTKKLHEKAELGGFAGDYVSWANKEEDKRRNQQDVLNRIVEERVKSGMSRAEAEKQTAKLTGTLELDQYKEYINGKVKSSSGSNVSDVNAKQFDTYKSQYMDWRMQDYIAKQTKRDLSDKERTVKEKKARSGIKKSIDDIRKTIKTGSEQEKIDAALEAEKNGRYHESGEFVLTIHRQGEEYINDQGQRVTAAVDTYLVTKGAQQVYRGQSYEQARKVAKMPDIKDTNYYKEVSEAAKE